MGFAGHFLALKFDIASKETAAAGYLTTNNRRICQAWTTTWQIAR
jgi:hypothetical protein